MSRLETYRNSFNNARLARSESGVLEVVLHTGGGTLVFDGHTMNNSPISFTASAPTLTIAWWF
jgi:hypothetical protein